MLSIALLIGGLAPSWHWPSPATAAVARQHSLVNAAPRASLTPANWAQQVEFTSSGAAQRDQFGSAVALSANGSTALIGAPEHNNSIGAAYVFVHSGSSWIQEAELSPIAGAARDSFGAVVALSADGRTALIFEQGNNSTGKVGVFVRSGASWMRQAVLTASDAADHTVFGHALALSANGGTALISAPYRNVNSGSVYIFARSGAKWSQEAEFTGSDTEPDDQFGNTVALSADGSTALIAAPFRNSGVGTAYIFVRRGPSWTQQAEFTPNDAPVNAQVGWVLALSADGRTALIYSWTAVYVLVQRGPRWTQQAKLTASDETWADGFGSAVALSANGSSALIAASNKDNGNEVGTAYVFTRSGSNWSQQAEMTSSDGKVGDVFGSGVALSAAGNTALIGAYGHNNWTGAAYIFSAPGSLVTGTSTPTPTPSMATSTSTPVGLAMPLPVPSPAEAPLTACEGPNDLLVENGPLVLEGSNQYDRVCIQDHGVLVTGNLSLRTGYLFVDATSALDADGPDGGYQASSVCGGFVGTGEPDAASGGTINVVARQAIIRGTLSANGGRGLDGTIEDCGGLIDNNGGLGGKGGNGGRISIHAQSLILTGTISARGGGGGSGLLAPQYSGSGNSSGAVTSYVPEPGGSGGNGGSILISTTLRPGGSATSLLHVGAGHGGKSPKGAKAGANGHLGVFSLARLSPSQASALPPPPPSLVTYLRGAPTTKPLSTLSAKLFACGHGDLVVDADQALTLSGTHRYAHICVQHGGVLSVGSNLTLMAQTILVEKGGQISASGTVPPDVNGTGNYEDAGQRTLDHSPPHAGVAGTSIPAPESDVQPTLGGSGGGMIELVAQQISIEGTLTANGLKGSEGYGNCMNCSSTNGAGGGSGGGILVVADQLQLSGSIQALGGESGAPGPAVGGESAFSQPFLSGYLPGTGTPQGGDSGLVIGSPGTAGFIKVFAHELFAPSSDLHLYGIGLVGPRLPSDPLPAAD
jgi:hypothetical protein